MPRIKPQQKVFGLHNLVLMEVESELQSLKTPLPPELPSLVRVVCYPSAKFLLKAHNDILKDDKRTFARFCRMNTDRAVKLLGIIFEKLAPYRKTSAQAKVWDFLLNHNCLVKQDGKFVLISDVDHNRRHEPPRLLSDLQDGEISEFLSYTPPTVTTANVHKARQALLKKLPR